MEIRPLSQAFGAEVTGVDLSAGLDAATFAAIEKAYSERSVLLFRGQRISDEQHVRFSRRLGELEIHTLREFVKPLHPELYVLSNIVENGKPIGIKDAGRNRMLRHGTMRDCLGLARGGIRAEDPVSREVIPIGRYAGRAAVGGEVQPAVASHINAAVDLSRRVVVVWQVQEF